MSKTNLVPFILEQYQNGQRVFKELDLENESFDGQDLEGIVFDGCLLYVSFRGANLRNARFINSGIKTCDFQQADLTNAHFENLSVERAEFSGSITENTYFDNNWAYGQAVGQSDFEEWIKNYPENEHAAELHRLRTIMQQLEKYLEYGNYEAHFEIELLCHSTHVEEIIPELNKRLRRHQVTASKLEEVSYQAFKRELSDKIHFKGNPGPNPTEFAVNAIKYAESSFWTLIEQKFNPSVTRFYVCPNDNSWIFWNLSFLIVSKERNKSYLFSGGASD